jgi:hypothetical protein
MILDGSNDVFLEFRNLRRFQSAKNEIKSVLWTEQRKNKNNRPDVRRLIEIFNPQASLNYVTISHKTFENIDRHFTWTFILVMNLFYYGENTNLNSYSFSFHLIFYFIFLSIMIYFSMTKKVFIFHLQKIKERELNWLILWFENITIRKKLKITSLIHI